MADLPHILVIDRASETAPHWAEAEYRRIILGQSPMIRCVLVAEGGFAVGSVVAGIGELESVAVASSSRRKGIGRALCGEVLRWCASEGAAAVELEVRAASEGPRKLYLQLGFVETGRRPRYYDDPVDDAILMRVELPASNTPGRIIASSW